MLVPVATERTCVHESAALLPVTRANQAVREEGETDHKDGHARETENDSPLAIQVLQALHAAAEPQAVDGFDPAEDWCVR